MERTGEFQQDTVSLDNTIERILKSGDHLVYVDEAVFKQRDFQRQAWSNVRDNL